MPKLEYWTCVKQVTCLLWICLLFFIRKCPHFARIFPLRLEFHLSCNLACSSINCCSFDFHDLNIVIKRIKSHLKDKQKFHIIYAKLEWKIWISEFIFSSPVSQGINGTINVSYLCLFKKCSWKYLCTLTQIFVVLFCFA